MLFSHQTNHRKHLQWFRKFSNRRIPGAVRAALIIMICTPAILYAAGTTVTASSTLRGTPEAVLDGEPSSWSAESGEQLLTLDLHYPVNIHSVGIY